MVYLNLNSNSYGQFGIGDDYHYRGKRNYFF